MDIDYLRFELEIDADIPNLLYRTVILVGYKSGIKVIYDKIQRGTESGKIEVISFSYNPENPIEGDVRIMSHRFDLNNTNSDGTNQIEVYGLAYFGDRLTDPVKPGPQNGLMDLYIFSIIGNRIVTKVPEMRGHELLYLNDAVEVLAGFVPELEAQEGVPDIRLGELEKRLRKLVDIEQDDMLINLMGFGGGSDGDEYLDHTNLNNPLGLSRN